MNTQTDKPSVTYTFQTPDERMAFIADADQIDRLQAENARLREALQRCEYLSSGAAYDISPVVRTINDAARQALSGGQGGESANS